MAVADSVRRAAAVLTDRRHRLPSWADRGLEHLKWARRPGSPDPETVPPTRVADRPARVLVAPANFAGQGHRWAAALTAAGVPAVSWEYAATAVFAFPVDHRAPIAVNRASRRWQGAVFADVVGTLDAVVMEAGRPLFGRLFGFDPVREAVALEAAGVRTALLWHGSDVRVPSAHAATHPDSPFADTDAATVARTRALEAVARRNRARLEGYGGPVLVSTPDLLAGLPGATWCPVVVSPDEWAVAEPALQRAAPVVVHVPSNPQLKGTDRIEPTLRRLHDEGLVEYRSAQGLPSAEVRELYRSADVVLDQFRLGIYGVAACEAMAAGRLVVSAVDDEVRSAVRDATGLELPVLQASADGLEDVLRSVCADRGPARELAAQGPAFVQLVHDGRWSARVLVEALGLG